jgi:phage-related protein
MVLEGGASYIDFTSNGLPSGGAVGGAINTIYNPAWTSGFMFEPSYSSSLDTQTRRIEAKFGDGYSQRQRDGLNSNNHTWKLSFENRSDREAKAIGNFIEDKGGVDSFELLISANKLVPDPKLKYVAMNPQTSPQSFNLNNVSAEFMRIYDQ